MKLRIADDFTIPVEAVTQTFGILAKRGMGKTYTAAVLVEELLKARSRVAVIDPIGVWYGLRAAANGKDPGLPIVVMGGEHGDLPLPSDAGKAVADFVVDSDQSVVLDLSLFRKGEQTRFMTDFAETLYHRNREPLHLVLDEADAFAPQRPQKGEERMLGAIEDLVRRGRARGIGVSLITQRAAVLNKNVLTQIEVLVVLRTISPQDRDAMDAWIKAHGSENDRTHFMNTLASLPVGEAWFWSPGWLDVFRVIKVRRRETFDSSATPKAGEAKRAPKKLADVDLDALKATFAASIEKAKADDPRELGKRIAELERELAAAKKAAPAIERVEVPVLTADDKTDLEELARLASHVGQGILVKVGQMAKAAGKVAHGPKDKKTTTSLHRDQPTVTAHAAVPVSPPRTRSKNANTNGDVGTGGLRRILTALAQRPHGLSNRQIGLRAGLSSRSGTFSTYISRARAHGWIDGRDPIRITEAGLEALGSYEPLPSGRELLSYWLGEVGASGASRMLQALADTYPRAMSNEELGEAAGISARSGTFSTYLSRLRGLELVVGRGELRASEELFS